MIEGTLDIAPIAAPARAGAVKRLMRHRLAVAALIVLAVLVIGSAGAPWLAPFDPEELDIANRYAAPFAAGHILGTDDLGRDVLTRLMYAGQISLSVGIAAKGEMVCLPASTLPNTQKRIIGSNYGGGVPERDFERILALYRTGRFELDRQVGKRVALEAINDAFRWLEQGVLARTLICFDH